MLAFQAPSLSRPTARMSPLSWIVWLLCATLLLAGCQTVHKGLTPAQIAVLKEEGFKETDEGWELGLSDKVLFDFDASTVKPEGRANVERLTRNLLRVGIDRMRLDGHTDNVGQAQYNDQLSLRRARAVADVVAAAGMPAANVQVRGLGAARPVADNGTAEGRAENRRVAIVITAE
ncbi:OmpA family protein [Bordetella genomosp. 9]|uniref:OmpA family protein n=1 Tax=Bordetella genomosp. 9 TaxID=1416803 RepID=UPI001E490076|nr:OmpA family protein [Bordetella genomosp. 9]